jgi:hypothetical protein
MDSYASYLPQDIGSRWTPDVHFIALCPQTGCDEFCIITHTPNLRGILACNQVPAKHCRRRVRTHRRVLRITVLYRDKTLVSHQAIRAEPTEQLLKTIKTMNRLLCVPNDLTFLNIKERTAEIDETVRAKPRGIEIIYAMVRTKAIEKVEVPGNEIDG